MRPVLKDLDLRDYLALETQPEDCETWPRTFAAAPQTIYPPAPDCYDGDQDETIAENIPIPLVPRGGFKFDAGKTRLDLLPLDALQNVAEVLTFGLSKGYPEQSWRAVTRARCRYMGAALRHLFARAGGEYLDRESGLPHMAHFACNALFLCSLDRGAEPFREPE